MTRRKLITAFGSLGLAGAWPAWLLPAQAQTGDAAALLRTGACAVVLRHAQTDPGIGDPPNFDLAQCSTQRNLSEAGRAQSRQIGQWFASRNLRPAAVLSSAWCRCVDTAELAFGQHTVLPALGSTFNTRSDGDAQTAVLKKRLAGLPAGRFEVWVTHQVNISALTGASTSMGEAVIVGTDGAVLLRSRFS